MTTSIPGNPYADRSETSEIVDAIVFSADGSHMQATEILLDQLKDATLVLAHEQRTATLVNVVRMYADLGMAEHSTGIIDAITDRLGGHGA